MEVDDALAELIDAARAGCDEASQDWKFRPAWRQRLWAAVRQYDALSGHVPPERALIPLPAPKPKPVAVMSDQGAEFAKFWAHYPRKSEGGPGAAEAAYGKARKIATAEEILAGLMVYPFRTDPSYQPTAAKWLSNRCWIVCQDTPPNTVVRERGRRHEAAELAEEVGMDLMTPISHQFPEGQKNGLAKSPANYAVAD